MKFSLIICTYERPKALGKLLKSVSKQRLYPDQILIIDGSLSDKTNDLKLNKKYPKLEYYKVEESERGLTRQRNYGITKIAKDIEIVCFLDDDIILTEFYFKELMQTYVAYPDAVGVGGYILEEAEWKNNVAILLSDEFEIDGWVRKLGSRNVLRKKLRILSDRPPGYMPGFGNGFSIGFLPPSGKIYPVEYFMGGVASYRKELFNKIKFSSYFKGYGLYEDMDFCLRASKVGPLYVNTNASLYHHHEPGGRPNKYNYGKMVIRNGWYVWRLKYPHPSIVNNLKWHLTAFSLSTIRLGNTITSNKKKEAFTEAMGRIAGWWSLLFNKPDIEQ